MERTYHYIIILFGTLLGLCACQNDPQWTPRVLTMTDSVAATYKSADMYLTLDDSSQAIANKIVVLYAKSDNADSFSQVVMNRDASGVWRAKLSGLKDSCTYNYKYVIEPLFIYPSPETYTFKTTPLPPPIVYTKEATNISNTSAMLNAEVTSIENDPVIERGFYYNLVKEDTIFRKQLKCGHGVGSFGGTIDTLRANATYYYVAYAKNVHGIAYGDTLQFNTLNPYK